MHKAVVRQGTRCTIQHLHEGAAKSGEVIIAPEKVSICGTDIQILRGQRDDPALVVGHEGLARVVEVGAGVSGLAVGDRVTINPTHPSNPNFLLGHNINGLLQQRVRIPLSAVSSGLISHVSSRIPAARGTLIEPLAVVTYALECLCLEGADSLLIVGDGLIGNLAAVVGRRTFGEQLSIGMLHRSALGLEWTKNFAPHVINGKSIESIEDALGNRIVILSATHRAGTAPGLTEATQKLGSRLVAAHLVGGVPPGTISAELPGVDLSGVRVANTGGPWPPRSTTFSRADSSIVITGNRGVTNRRLEAAATLLEESEFGNRADQLITHDLQLEKGVEALNSILSTGSRVLNGELVIRLVIEMS